jgi:transcriptional regulator with PAS, ATPase and Fis domain
MTLKFQVKCKKTLLAERRGACVVDRLLTNGALAEYEIKIINQYVKQHGTLRKAAAALGVSHSLLSYKLKRYYESHPDDPAAKLYE